MPVQCLAAIYIYLSDLFNLHFYQVLETQHTDDFLGSTT